MRKIIVLSMVSLDGVMQAPGGPQEDLSQAFKYGGWTAPYADKAFGEAMQKELQPADYILGRKTFDIWENYWPAHGDFWPAINEGTKYVLSGTRHSSNWNNTVFIQNLDDIQKIKASQGRDLHVWGSSEIVHLLFKHGLVDELRLKIYPLLLGNGKKLFDAHAHASAFELDYSIVTSKGVILANYRRAGKVETGNVNAG